MWQRMQTGQATKGAKGYHWAMIGITPDDTPEGDEDGHAFLLLRKHRWTAVSLLAYAFLAIAAAWQRARDGDTSLLDLIPELVSRLRGTVIPDPRRDEPHKDAWSWWRRHRQYLAQQAHKRWNAYADEAPQP